MSNIESYPLRRYMLDQARGRLVQKVNHLYEVRITPAALNTDTFNVINVDTDSDFEWRGTLGRVADTDANAGQVILPYGQTNALITVRLGGPGGLSWSNTPSMWGNVVGMRPMPAMFVSPKMVPAGSQFHVTVNLLSNVTGPLGITFIVQFVGVKVFVMSAPAPAPVLAPRRVTR